jgi:hypothetical protein
MGDDDIKIGMREVGCVIFQIVLPFHKVSLFPFQV